MLDSLYTEAIRKKNSLNNHAEEIFDKTLDIESKWIDEKVPSSGENYVLAAGDGSFNKKKFLGFNFYAVAAESLIYNPNDDERLKSIESVELDILSHQSFFDDRIRNLMGMFEIKTAIKTFRNHDVDYYMDDGSLLGDLIRPIPIDNDIPRVLKSDILKRIQEKLENDISTEISSLNFKEEFGELFEDGKVNENALIAFLENIERLMALKHLFNNKENLIAISKTSTSNDIFHANVPDIAIFDKFTVEEGFSKPYYKKVNSEVKRDFPISNSYFRDMWFTVFFVRLERNKNIIKVELPYHALEDDIRKIIGILKSNSTEGYPFLLKRAHNDVVIKHKDINSLSQIIEFLDKSGREMLD